MIQKVNWKEWVEKGKKIGVIRLGLLIVAGLVLLIASFDGKEEHKTADTDKHTKRGEAIRGLQMYYRRWMELEKYKL